MLLCGLLALLCATAGMAAEAEQREADQARLADWQPYVGQWRGVGLPKQGSNQGAWTEQAAWSWHFENGRAELVAELKRNKYFSRLQVRPGTEPEKFLLLATPVGDGEPLRFLATHTDGTLVAVRETAQTQGDEIAGAKAALPARITFRLIAGGARMTTLFEKRLAEEAYARLAEVGSTRQGSDFAKAAASGPECVVTGGLGTIAVEHAGKTYFVCCGGCADLFNEDPAGVLAAYRKRKAEQRAQPEAKR